MDKTDVESILLLMIFTLSQVKSISMASKELLGLFMGRTLKAEHLLRTLQKDLEFLGKVLAYKSEREKDAATKETAALQAQVRIALPFSCAEFG